MPPKKDDKGKGGAKDKGKAAGGAKGGKADKGEWVVGVIKELRRFELSSGILRLRIHTGDRQMS